LLVLRPGALGDTLLAVPALRALRRRYSSIALAAHAAAARLLLQLGEVDRALAFDDPRVGGVLNGEDAGEPVVAWLDAANAPRLQAMLIAPSKPAGEVHCARWLVQTLGIDEFHDSPLTVEPLHADEVLVHPGSGSATKNWPAARFAQLIEGLPMARLVAGEADEAAVQAVERCAGRALPRLQEPDLLELARRLAGCRAYLGNDSGVSHLAGLVGAPTHVLFGPTSPTVWRPLGPRVHIYGFDTRPADLAARL
jgi:ADP-heptose:LPS heptosyltransferase